MSTAIAVDFHDADLLHTLGGCSQADLDGLGFGVIGIDAATLVQRYNACESRLAGLSPERVLGRPLFTVVAPCMNNFMVAHRFEDAASRVEALDATIDYVLTLRMKPVAVKLRLLAAPKAALRYVVIERRP